MAKKKKEFTCPERARLQKFSDLLFDSCYTYTGGLDCTAYLSEEPLSFADRFMGRKVQLEVGDKWGVNVFDCAWFHITGKIPQGADTFVVNNGGEGLIFDRNGNEVQAITCKASDYDSSLGGPVKRIIPLYDCLVDGDKIDLWIDCAANDLFGNLKNDGRLVELHTAKHNKNIRDLAYDVHVLLTVVDSGEDEEFSKQVKAELLDIACDYLTDEDAATKKEKIAHLLKEKSNEDFTYYAVGHAHLDLAWLWPIRESFRKGGRTFATQIKNIERYPGYVFGASQAQLYTWVKDRYPKLYAKVKELAKEGKWDVQGATWVEPDSNLIGGESLVRQFFYGKKFYRDEFDMDMKVFWVPDSFGYSACIPQVMKLADVPYFLTQKMSWSIYNDFPYHSFYWKGLDGSTVLAHMLPENTYNSPCRGDLMKKGEKRYIERPISNKSMMLYGIGDGGAGPGYEHIERAKRYEDLRSMPKVKMCRTMDFWKDFDDGVTPYPTFSGELYLERHQGTYTTRSATKKFNRKCEYALRNYEAVAAKAQEKGIALPISHVELEEMWKEVLLYQFHDILPGSSINRVYDECIPRYEAMYNNLTNSTENLISQMTNGKTAVNLNSFAYDTKVKCADDWYAVTIPAMGSVKLTDDNKITEFKNECTYNSIENDKVKVTFKEGCVCSLFDKTLQREFITEGTKAGLVSMYDDYGDCWDMTNCRAEYINTKKDAECIAFETDDDGAKVYAECKFKVKDTVITQVYYLLDGDSTLYCDMDVDMQNTKSMIRMAVPVNVNTDEANFNIQFGHLARKTTENNSVELAQFEVSGQKFVDMSDDDSGISFINDCKYGYRCKHGIIDLNLIRSPEGGPGKVVDQGHHEIHWALAPHAGKLGTETYKKAYFVNNPVIVTNGTAKEESVSAYNTTNETVILETVKVPEDSNGIIARFYNCSKSEQTAEITMDGYQMAEIVNIMEEKLSDKTDGKLTLHGFELINVRFIKN